MARRGMEDDVNLISKSKARGRHRALQEAAAKEQRRRELQAAERRGYAEHKMECAELVSTDAIESEDVRVMRLGQPPDKPYVMVDARHPWGEPRSSLYELRSVKQYIRIGNVAAVWWGWEVAHGVPAR